jgi:hypothetical protein
MQVSMMKQFASCLLKTLATAARFFPKEIVVPWFGFMTAYLELFSEIRRVMP